MDTEEDREIKHAAKSGHSQTDEGPYYHEAWWEAYKGSVKGKLGGSIIGAVVGAVVGVAAVAVLAVTVGLGALGLGTAASAGLMITAAFSAAGMAYGAHEFGDIGKNVGSNAAVAEKQEQRENVRFAALENKIDELKSMISGKKPAADTPKAIADSTDKNSPNYRTSHCDEHCPPEKPKFVFWKIATIGLATGLAAGGLLYAGGATEVLGQLGTVGEALHHHALAASMTTMGLFGASFGINRDMFRQVFDRTDLAFKGILNPEKSHAPQVSASIEQYQAPEKSSDKFCGASATPIITMVSPDQVDTFHRDQLAKSARLALLNMDHNTASRQ